MRVKKGIVELREGMVSRVAAWEWCLGLLRAVAVENKASRVGVVQQWGREKERVFKKCYFIII